MSSNLTSSPQKIILTTIVSQFLKSSDHPIFNLQEDELIYEPLKGGGSAATLYRFGWHDQFYVLRLFPTQSTSATRLHQIKLARLAGDFDLGPKILFVDSQMNGMIMQFIPGRTVSEVDFTEPANIAAFAKFIKTMHSLEADFPSAVSPFRRFDDFYVKMMKSPAILPARFLEVKILMGELEELFQLWPVKNVPSHLDLHPLNIMLWENRFFLVDWVNGGMSDPYFDLATFCIFHGLNSTTEILFLSAYLGREPTKLEWHRFIVTQPIRLLVIAAALFSSNSDNSISYEKLLQDKSLPSWQDFTKKGAIWPHSHLGACMFKTALALIDQEQFQDSLHSLKNLT